MLQNRGPGITVSRGMRVLIAACFFVCLLATPVVHVDSASMEGKGTPAGVKAVMGEEGQILVVDESTGRTLHKLAKPEGLVREMFALEGGSVVATTQKDFTEFWDPATGKSVRRFEGRIYAFSHDEGSCVTYTSDGNLVVYKYPELSVKLVLVEGQGGGPSGMLFSPDDRYLVVEFCNQYPLSDEMFVNPILDKTWYRVVLFDLSTNEQILSSQGRPLLGEFSEDSRYYIAGDGRTFDLMSRSFVRGRVR